MWVTLGGLLNKKKNTFRFKLDNADLPKALKKILEKTYPSALEFVSYKNIQNNILYIKTKNPMWITELEVYKNKIKDELNKKREKPIESIKIILE